MFFYLDESVIPFDDVEYLVKNEFRKDFDENEMRPFLFSELCVIDMLYAINNARDGYYRDRLVLKGGHSVRNFVTLLDHRFSFDVDFNANSHKKFTFGDVERIKRDLHDYASSKRCPTSITNTRDNNLLYFLELGYKEQFKKKLIPLPEAPKIEFCKTCRIHDKPSTSEMNTMIDLRRFGMEPPMINHVSLEEQLVHKLHTIGSKARKRRHFDAYDAFRICNGNKINWKKAKEIFALTVKTGKPATKRHIQECRRYIDAMKRDDGIKRHFDAVVFRPDSVNIGEMLDEVKGYYDFTGT